MSSAFRNWGVNMAAWANLCTLQSWVVFVIHQHHYGCCLLQKMQTIVLFLGNEFGSRIPGHSLLQGRLGRVFAWWHRQEDTHVSKRCYAVGCICVEYFCCVSSIIVFCCTNGIMELWKMNNQGRSISTLVISVSPLGKAIQCAKSNLKWEFKILALWKHSRNSC